MIARTTSPQQTRLNGFLNLGLVIGFVLFGPYGVMRVLENFPFSGLQVTSSMAGMWNFFTALTLFSHPIGYWVACVCVVVFILSMAILRPWSRVHYLLSLLLTLCVIALMFTPYRPAVQAIPMHEMHVPTAPSWWSQGLRTAQAMSEKEGCAYQILGWQGETLLYQADCPGNDKQIWQFAPAISANPVHIDEMPTIDLHIEQLAREKTLSYVHAGRIYPPEEEPSVRSLYVPEAGFSSANGKWVALVSKYLYSIEDVVVVKTKS